MPPDRGDAPVSRHAQRAQCAQQACAACAQWQIQVKGRCRQVAEVRGAECRCSVQAGSRVSHYFRQPTAELPQIAPPHNDALPPAAAPRYYGARAPARPYATRRFRITTPAITTRGHLAPCA